VPVYRLHAHDEWFPPAERADENGLLAVGGDLRPERILTAYSQGIFPWYNDGLPILWHSPDPRFALTPAQLHVPKSLAKLLRQGRFEVKLDTAFAEVIDACATSRRPGQRGTWITRDMRDAYVRLHQLGFAHSAESYLGGTLVGGLYGVSLGSVFFGESMFAQVADASKVAFASLARQLGAWSFSLIDCQQETDHLARFGAEAWPRATFLARLAEGLGDPTRRGRWALDAPR
jgi:leucyl/phenylalanyl-tRNA---protein transferase